MLVVISVIGIVSAIAVPAISTFIDKAEDVQAIRNAQNLASSYSAARVAGYDFADGETELSGIVENVVTGATISLGVGADLFVGVPGLGADEQADALTHLELIERHLAYKR